jgi:hypothetical protein
MSFQLVIGVGGRISSEVSNEYSKCVASLAFETPHYLARKCFYNAPSAVPHDKHSDETQDFPFIFRP